MVMAPIDDLAEAFRTATLRSECTRILGLLLVFAAALAVLVTRALLTGVPEQLVLMPQIVALLMAAAAYEVLMLAHVRRALRRGDDLPSWAWAMNIGVETLIPSAAIFLLTRSAFIGPYRALAAPAAHSYYFFIILSALRLRPVLCFLTGLASALGFAALTAYTVLNYPAGPNADGTAYLFQVYVTYGLFFLISSSIAAGLTAHFRRHVLTALREAEARRRFKQLEREVAERRRAEEALRASERRYRQLTEGTRDAIVVADGQGRITLFNPAAQQIFGYSEREVLGQPLAILTPPDDLDMLRRHLDAGAREGCPGGLPAELRGRRKGGAGFPMELSLTALELPEGVVFLAAIRDATERQRLQARLVQSENLASLGLLSAGMAHEINNPLAYVSNNLAILERDVRLLKDAAPAREGARAIPEPPPPDGANAAAAPPVEGGEPPSLQEEIERLLGSTRRGVKRVAEIVQNLRRFARLDQAEFDRVDLHEALTSSLDLLRGRLDQCQVAVERDFGDLPPVACAPAQINLAFMNLLVNAVQAIEATARGHGRIEIRTRVDGGAVVVELADDGCGIPAQ